jgi:hypothetical protein
MTSKQKLPWKRWPACVGIGLGALALASCGHSAAPPQAESPAPAESLAALMGGQHQLTLPKVPFGNAPCQTLSADDQKALGATQPGAGKPDRAPAGLPFDNVCMYYPALGVTVGYQAKVDYDMNHDSNRSTDRQAPAGLPGAFYDRQGGLWLAKDGYYVVLNGSQALIEKASPVVAAKL